MLVLIAGLVVMGCKPDEGEVVWKKEIRSPDGYWVALTEAREMGGLGTAYADTRVSLKHSGDPDKNAMMVISIEDDKIDVQARWLSARHLSVIYKGKAEVGFQAIKCGDVEISLQHLPA